MTCIVGLKQGVEIYMGGDSAGVAGYDVTTRADVKVFRNGPFLFGYTTSFRMGQLLRFKLKVPDRGKGNLFAYMVTDFIPAVRRCFKNGGFGDDKKGGQFLVGGYGRLFCIDDDFQVGESKTGFDSVGCGFAYALGSLFSTAGEHPRDRVRQALQSAEKFSGGVTGPFKILRI